MNLLDNILYDIDKTETRLISHKERRSQYENDIILAGTTTSDFERLVFHEQPSVRFWVVKNNQAFVFGLSRTQNCQQSS